MRIFKHLRTDWFRYGFETLAVIVGILIAFALENWNDKRIEQQKVKLELASLKEALLEDGAFLERTRVIDMFRTHSLQHLLELTAQKPVNMEYSNYSVIPLEDNWIWE